MKILVDLRALSHKKISGVELYIQHQLQALIQATPDTEFVLWSNSKTPTPEIFEPFTVFTNVRCCQTTIPNKILNISLAFLRAPKLDRWIGEKMGIDHFDAVWIPDPRPAPVRKKCKKILTIHDLSPFHFQHTFNTKTRLWHKMLRLPIEIKEATNIITPSKYTKQDLINTLKVDPSKIVPIPEASTRKMFPETDQKLIQSVRDKYQLPPKFFLTLSTLEPRKNLRGLIEDFSDWKRKTSHPHALVLAGKKHPQIFSSLELPENQKDMISTGFVSEEEKRVLFSSAEAFIFPSFFEGFGLPLVEAMTCGCPILSSNTSSLPEVLGDAGILFDPYDKTAIPLLLESFLSSPEKKENMKQQSLKRSRTFSWEKSAQDLLKLL